MKAASSAYCRSKALAVHVMVVAFSYRRLKRLPSRRYRKIMPSSRYKLYHKRCATAARQMLKRAGARTEPSFNYDHARHSLEASKHDYDLPSDGQKENTSGDGAHKLITFSHQKQVLCIYELFCTSPCPKPLRASLRIAPHQLIIVNKLPLPLRLVMREMNCFPV